MRPLDRAYVALQCIACKRTIKHGRGCQKNETCLPSIISPKKRFRRPPIQAPIKYKHFRGQIRTQRGPFCKQVPCDSCQSSTPNILFGKLLHNGLGFCRCTTPATPPVPGSSRINRWKTSFISLDTSSFFIRPSRNCFYSAPAQPQPSPTRLANSGQPALPSLLSRQNPFLDGRSSSNPCGGHDVEPLPFDRHNARGERHHRYRAATLPSVVASRRS